MQEMLLVAFATFFATIGPLDVGVVFAALTGSVDPKSLRSMAVRGTLLGGGILLLFAIFGDAVLKMFGISIPALRIGGGILLLLIAIDLVFARSTGGTTATDEEQEEAVNRSDISVFPLATPLIAGPGAISAVILLMTSTNGDPRKIGAVIIALLAVLLLTLLSLLLASQIKKWFGVTGVHVISRVFGVLLAALAVQFILDGLVISELFLRITKP